MRLRLRRGGLAREDRRVPGGKVGLDAGGGARWLP